MTSEEWAAEAKHAYALGYRLHKIKARPWFEVQEQVEAITAVVPDDYQLRVDANDSFETAARTIEVARQLKDFNIESFETPIPQSHIDGYREIKQHTDMPITIHFGNPDPVEAIRAKMNDSFIIAYPDSRAANAKREAIISDAAHLLVWIQIVGLGITTSYVMHLAAVMRNATMPAITLNALRAFDIVTPSTIPLVDGYATIPDKPGLGVELDEDALDNCRV
jgi:L-alanine-DL-glutamate epimerase-like enolase superfamily enzyme